MRIAIINLITKTADLPSSKFSLLMYLISGKAPNPPEDDTEINIVELSREIAKLGHEVTVYISDAYSPRRALDAGLERLEVVYLPTRLKFLFNPSVIPFIPSLYREICKNKFDLVFSAEILQWGTFLSMLACIKTKKTIFIWQELGFFPRFPGNIILKVYLVIFGFLIKKIANGLIPRNISAKNFLVKNKFPIDKILPVVNTGVNTSVFFPIGKKDAREELGLGNKHIIISVGRLHEDKGHYELINAIKLIKNEFPDILLIIIGKGPEYDNLVNVIRGLKLEQNVKIIEYVPKREKLRLFYNAADLMVILRPNELFPNFTVLESLACGVPVVHSSEEGVDNLLGNGYCSYYVNRDDVDEIYHIISHLLKNKDLLEEMGYKAKQIVDEKFSMNIIAEKLLRIWSDIGKNV